MDIIEQRISMIVNMRVKYIIFLLILIVSLTIKTYYNFLNLFYMNIKCTDIFIASLTLFNIIFFFIIITSNTLEEDINRVCFCANR